MTRMPCLRAVSLLAPLAIFIAIPGRVLYAQTVQRPTDPLFQSGMAAFNARNYARAEQVFRELREIDPSDSRAVGGISEIYMAQQKDAEAVEFLRSEIQKDPDRFDYHLMLGNILVRTKQYDLAISEYQNLLELSGNNPSQASDLCYRIGEAYRRAGKLTQAIPMLERAIKLNPALKLAAQALAQIAGASRDRE
jgi:tetratricopeptide (TPR) repeat protein